MILKRKHGAYSDEVMTAPPLPPCFFNFFLVDIFELFLLGLISYLYFYRYRGGAAWQPMGHVTGVNDGVGVNDLNITDLSEGARTPSRYHLPSY